MDTEMATDTDTDKDMGTDTDMGTARDMVQINLYTNVVLSSGISAPVEAPQRFVVLKKTDHSEPVHYWSGTVTVK